MKVAHGLAGRMWLVATVSLAIAVLLALLLGGPVPASTASGSYEIATGSYIGNGGTQSIVGVGFEPDVVIVFRGGRAAVVKGDDAVWGTGSVEWDGGWSSSMYITSLDADGFTLGSGDTNVNQFDRTYYYTAIRGGPSLIQTGSFVKGADPHSVTGVGFAPVMVWVFRADSSLYGVIKTNTMGGGGFTQGGNSVPIPHR